MTSIIVGKEIEKSGYVIDETTGEYIACVSSEERLQQLAEQEEKSRKEFANSKKSGYKNFVQVNREYCGCWISLIRQDPNAAKVLFFLIEHIDSYNSVICAHKVIEDALVLSSATISRALACLRKNGFIDIQRSGQTSNYIINPQLLWGSWGKNMQYCDFCADVTLKPTPKRKLKTTKQITKKN